jgi:uncharacterized protein (DUF488 family)
MTTLYTIGFTRSSAERFFGRLRAAGVRHLVDTRLHNVSQLAGFSKHPDLGWFLGELVGATYEHRVDLAPTDEMLKAYKAGRIDWPAYERMFADLLRDRQVEHLDRAIFEGPTALLCSEATAERCHRRLVAEHLAGHWGDLTIEHL